MNKIYLLILTVILSVFSTNLCADLKTDRAVVRNDGTEQVVAVASFQEPIAGDLYIATQVNGALLFILNDGKGFSTIPAPFQANSDFSTDLIVLDEPGQGISAGRYPLYKVVTQSDTDPLDFRNWIGGLNGLHSINFMIGLSSDETQDLDEDGFPDDDLNRDGFHDDDMNRDGFHDDGETLAKNKGCFDCHTVNSQLVGPAFREIAAKFENNAENLANIILNGSREETNPITLSEVESRTLADWLLSLI
tara:strand:- start:1748 stop:2494 length:747 start_codon:yes stop_codon:yes gene_type:complete